LKTQKIEYCKAYSLKFDRKSICMLILVH